jgi:hypothetical protein
VSIRDRSHGVTLASTGADTSQGATMKTESTQRSTADSRTLPRARARVRPLEPHELTHVVGGAWLMTLAGQ